MSIVQTFFEHQLVVKMYHFQTKKYGAHKAADGYLVKYALNFDRIMEVWQGAHGRLSDHRISITFDTVNDQTIISHLDAMVGFLSRLNNGQITVDLAAIRDEMIADIQQFKYLLTFE